MMLLSENALQRACRLRWVGRKEDEKDELKMVKERKREREREREREENWGMRLRSSCNQAQESKRGASIQLLAGGDAGAAHVEATGRSVRTVR